MRPVFVSVGILGVLLLGKVLPFSITIWFNEEVAEGLANNLNTIGGLRDTRHLRHIRRLKSVHSSHSFVVDGHDLLESIVTFSLDCRGFFRLNTRRSSLFVDFDDLFVDLDLLSFDDTLSHDGLLSLLFQLRDQLNQLLLDIFSLVTRLLHLLEPALVLIDVTVV